jgi:hypothetical protein
MVRPISGGEPLTVSNRILGYLFGSADLWPRWVNNLVAKCDHLTRRKNPISANGCLFCRTKDPIALGSQIRAEATQWLSMLDLGVRDVDTQRIKAVSSSR